MFLIHPYSFNFIPQNFQFSQASLSDYMDCARRFQLRYLLEQDWPAVESEPLLERERFADGLARLRKNIKTAICAHESSVKIPGLLEVIKKELLEVRDKYGDDRRSIIIDSAEEVTIEDLIAEENMVITVSHAGYIKRTPTSLYRRQRRGGKGIAGMDTKDEDWVEYLFIGSTHDYMMFFTDRGRAHWLKIYDLPQGGRATREGQ